MWNPIKSLKQWCNNMETERLAKEQVQIEQAREILFNALDTILEKHPEANKLKAPWDSKNPNNLQLTPEQLEIVKKKVPHHTLEIISLHKIADIKSDKGPKDIFYNFFGMDETWPLWRNVMGLVMVHSPEYPTYFIPAYTQSKATGEAGDLKKGEGPRGLITGGLEGIAVGALVSGRKLKFKEMVPYIGLGMGLQMISCTVFPWLGEKMGRNIYNKNNPSEALNTPSKVTLVQQRDNSNNKPQVYSQISSLPKGNIRI